MFKGKKSRISRSEHEESNLNIKTELIWIYWNIKKNIIQLNVSGFGLAPLLTSFPLMEDGGLSSPYCWVLSCQCDPARAPQGRVCRPWLLYTVQSNFAFKLFEFFSVSNYPPPKSTMTLAFNFSGLLVLFFSFFSSVSSDYGMFGQVLILIFLIWFFCQVDWNPAFVRSRWYAFENRDHQNQRCWKGNNKQKLFSILYTYFLNLCSSSRLWSETIQPDKAFVFKLFKSC
jgi:hypothetical protein